MKTSTKTLNAKIDQSRRQVQYMEQNRVIDDQREVIAKLKAEIKEANEHIETLANKLLDSK